MKIEPEAQEATRVVLTALSQTEADVGIIACLNTAVRVLMLKTGLKQDQAVDALKKTLEQFKNIEV